MEYVLCNFYVPDNTLLDNQLTNNVFKDYAYNAKIKNKETKLCMFTYVAIPLLDLSKLPNSNEVIDYVKHHTSLASLEMSEPDIQKHGSIYKVLVNGGITNSYKFTYDIIGVIKSDQCDIFYSDGSSTTKLEKAASYGTVKLLNESISDTALFDSFSQTTYEYQTFSGKINDGTNNIGELTGVKMAIDNMGDSQIQVIISDSEYSLKCFREWIYNWKKNGYIASNRKKILNCELIQNIQSEIEKSKKIYLFKWTKGHVNTPFNELCDELAKNELGIEK